MNSIFGQICFADLPIVNTPVCICVCVSVCMLPFSVKLCCRLAKLLIKITYRIETFHSDVRQAKDRSCRRVATVALLHEICQR